MRIIGRADFNRGVGPIHFIKLVNKRHPIFRLPNLLSIFRVFLAIPASLFILNGQKELAIVTFFISAFTDYLDGWAARRFNEVSELGKIVDPLADKIFVTAVIVSMFAEEILPLWFILPIVGRDFLILVGGLVVKSKTGLVLPSNWTGKWAVGLIGLVILLIYVGVEGTARDSAIAATFGLLAISLGHYAVRMIRVIAESKESL